MSGPIGFSVTVLHSGFQDSNELEFAFDRQLVEEVLDVRLILQKPIDRWLAVHRFGDRFGGRFSVGLEKHLRIVFSRDDRRIEPDRDDDPQVIGFGFGDVSLANRIEHTVSDGGLNSPHEDIGVLFVVDGDFADHHRYGANLHIAVEDRIDF